MTENMKKLNLLLNTEQEGTLKVENVNDDLFKDASIVLNITEKILKFKPKFEQEKPIFEIDVELAVLVEEVDEENPDQSFLKRNKEFLTKTLVEKTKETVKKEALAIIEYCKEQQVDLIGVYENFYRKQYKKFKKYYDENKEKYLNGIEYSISVKVSSSY